MFFNKRAKLLKATEEQLLVTQTELSKTKKELQSIKAEFENINELQATTQSSLQNCINTNIEINNKYAPLIEKDKVLIERQLEIVGAEKLLLELNEKYKAGLMIHADLERDINLYQDSLEIGSFGLYKPQFGFETSEQFKQAIDDNYLKQKELVKNDEAVVCNTVWEVGGSKSEGKKMTNRYKKLMLFAFNGECDSCIAKVKWNNAEKTKDRIAKAFENINKLGETHNIRITEQFLQLKLDELGLTYEYEQKKYDEKEEQRIIREQMREEEKAQRELERAQKEAEDEERRFEKALDKAKQELGSSTATNVDSLNDKIRNLEQQLQEAHDRKERAISLAQQTKVGHIYIISNIGSFGHDIYKIGMTRRLDPLDRVKELGDASVPFHFDVHAIIYSENAPQLEYELHRKFAERRLNRINNKKEFFRVTLVEIETFIKEHANAEIQFTQLAEAREYRETLTFLEQLNKLVDQPKEEIKFPTSLV